MRIAYFALIILLLQGCRPNIQDLKQKYSVEAINYFYETAFFTDNEGKRNELTKWNKDVNIYLIGDYSTDDILYTKNAIAQLDSLQLPIDIYLTTDSLTANMFVYFGNYQYLKKMGIEDSIPFLGKALVTSTFYIESAIVGISSDASSYKRVNQTDSIKLRRSIILEEIAQSLGIYGDSWLYPSSSRFFEGGSSLLNLSHIDKEIIRFLYEPLIPSQYPREQFEKDFKDVLHNIDAVPKIVKYMSDNNIPLSYLKYIRENCFYTNHHGPDYITDSVLVKWPSEIYIKLRRGFLKEDSIFFEKVLTTINSVSNQFQLSLTNDSYDSPVINMSYAYDDTLKAVIMIKNELLKSNMMFPRRRICELTIVADRKRNDQEAKNESISYFLYNALLFNTNDENFEIMDTDSLGNISLKHDYREILKLMYEPVFYSGLTTQELDGAIEILKAKEYSNEN